MGDNNIVDETEIDRLFERYRQAPQSCVFAPLADACRKIGRNDEAIEICRRGLLIHPEYASGHVVLGKCLYDSSKFEEAEESFEYVLGLDPENLVALKYLGLILSAKGDQSKAAAFFNRILELDPENKEILEKTVELEDLEDEEILDLKPIVEDGFEGNEINLHSTGDAATSDELATVTLADIFASQGYKAKAAKIFKEVLNKDPENEIIREKLKELGMEEAGSDKAGKIAASGSTGSDLDDDSSPDSRRKGWTGDGAGAQSGEEPGTIVLDEILETEADSADKDPQQNDAAYKSQESEKTGEKNSDADTEQSHSAKKIFNERGNLEMFKKWLKSTEE